MREGRQDLEEILNKEPPSATGMVADAEALSRRLHCSRSQPLPVVPSQSVESGVAEGQEEILGALKNIQERLRVFHPAEECNESSSSSLLHAARQLSYWSSVFVSMAQSQNSLHLPTSPSNGGSSPTPGTSSSPDQGTSSFPTPATPSLFIVPATVATSSTSSQSLHTSAAVSHSADFVADSTASTSSCPVPQASIALLASAPSITARPTLASASSTAPTVNPLEPTLPNQSLPPSTQTTTPSSATHTALPSLPPVDRETLEIFQRYGQQSCSFSEWLSSLAIPRRVESLQQVKDLWETGTANCPPLKEWSRATRNHKGAKGSNASIFSQRKYIYNFLKSHNFDEELIASKYNEVKPGKLYKILNSKKVWTFYHAIFLPNKCNYFLFLSLYPNLDLPYISFSLNVLPSCDLPNVFYSTCNYRHRSQ